MDRGDFYSGGALIERVHQFEKLGLIKYCVLINRHVVTAFETCNGIIEIAGSCVFSRVILQRISKNTLRVWYDRFANMDHRSRDLDYNINSVARLIEDVMKQTRGKMTIRAPGRDTMVYQYNEIGWIIVILLQNNFVITTNMDGFVNIIERNTAYQSNADQEASIAKRIIPFKFNPDRTKEEQTNELSLLRIDIRDRDRQIEVLEAKLIQQGDHIKELESEMLNNNYQKQIEELQDAIKTKEIYYQQAVDNACEWEEQTDAKTKIIQQLQERIKQLEAELAAAPAKYRFLYAVDHP